MNADTLFDASIIITSFNHRDYLVESVDSVLAQTVKPREIILADDGSTDGSVEVIRNYAELHPDRIVPVLHENMGIPRNRNSALKLAKGLYVGVLDGDDLFRPHKLEREREALRRNPDAMVVYSNYSIFKDGGEIISKRYNTPQPQGDVLYETADLKFGIMRSMIARTEAVRAAGLMDPDLPKYDGLWLTIQLAASGRFAYVDEILVDKREHPSGDSNLNMKQDIKDLRTIYQRVKALTAHLPAAQRTHLDTRWTQILDRLKDRK